jgi:hypothetical protein
MLNKPNAPAAAITSAKSGVRNFIRELGQTFDQSSSMDCQCSAGHKLAALAPLTTDPFSDGFNASL